MFKSGLSATKFLALLPLVGALVKEVVDAIRDDKVIDAEEWREIGEKFHAIVYAVVHGDGPAKVSIPSFPGN